MHNLMIILPCRITNPPLLKSSLFYESTSTFRVPIVFTDMRYFCRSYRSYPLAHGHISISKLKEVIPRHWQSSRNIIITSITSTERISFSSLPGLISIAPQTPRTRFSSGASLHSLLPGVVIHLIRSLATSLPKLLLSSNWFRSEGFPPVACLRI